MEVRKERGTTNKQPNHNFAKNILKRVGNFSIQPHTYTYYYY